MKSLKLYHLFFLACLFNLTGGASGQNLSFSAQFEFEATTVTVGPKVGIVNIVISDEARKNHVEGVAKVDFVFGKDFKVREVTIVQDLPFGVGESLVRAVSELRFSPAMNGNERIDIKASLICTLFDLYGPLDKNVIKVKWIGKPAAEYPAAFRTEGTKGKVFVSATFFPDGKIQVGWAQSTMPIEFDEAAKKAAANLKFQPAVHKETRKPVAQLMWIEFEFKP